MSRMTGPRWWLIAAVVVLGALAAVSTTGRGAAGASRQPAGAAQPVTATSYVCPTISGSADAPTTANVATLRAALPHRAGDAVTTTVTPLSGPDAAPRRLATQAVTRLRTTNKPVPLLVTARGAAADTVVADQRRLVPSTTGRGLVSSRCFAPGTDWWITGAEGRIGFTDLLFLANPGTDPANVTVTAWTSRGAVQPPKLRAYTVPPRGSVVLPVADYTPDAALVTLHVVANAGRITAEVVDRRINGIHAAGVDWIQPTKAPSRDLVVPGFPGGSGARRLVVTNPGDTDATVGIRLATLSGNFSPAGHPTVLVRARHSVSVDLTDSFAGTAGAVVLHSDQPVVAAGMTQSTAHGRSLPDVQWHPAQRAITTAAGFADSTAPFQGAIRLYLTAGDFPTQVRLSSPSGHSVVVDVRAGRTAVVDPRTAFGDAATGPLAVTPLGGAAIYVSRMLYTVGAHGPLATSEEPLPLPLPVALPPVVQDPRAALP